MAQASISLSTSNDPFLILTLSSLRVAELNKTDLQFYISIHEFKLRIAIIVIAVYSAYSLAKIEILHCLFRASLAT